MSGLGEFHQGRVNAVPNTSNNPNPKYKKTDISRFIVISFIGRKRWYQWADSNRHAYSATDFEKNMAANIYIYQ
ncbi:MAG: hypothetical protein CL578_01855 [Alteromonadaceae bacterium]|nr:hypothetical protein [Alteromonadaceae bacterium]